MTFSQVPLRGQANGVRSDRIGSLPDKHHFRLHRKSFFSGPANWVARGYCSCIFSLAQDRIADSFRDYCTFYDTVPGISLLAKSSCGFSVSMKTCALYRFLDVSLRHSSLSYTFRLFHHLSCLVVALPRSASMRHFPYLSLVTSNFECCQCLEALAKAVGDIS